MIILFILLIFLIIILIICIYKFNLSKNINKNIKKYYEDSNNKYTAIIVEPCKHKALEFFLNNFLENLSSEWNIT